MEISDFNAKHELAESRSLTADEFAANMRESLASAISPRHPTFQDVQNVIDMGRALGQLPNGPLLSLVYKFNGVHAIFIMSPDGFCDCESCKAAMQQNKPTIH